MRLRKVLSVGLAFLLAASLAACGGEVKGERRSAGPVRVERVEFQDEDALWMQRLAASWSETYEMNWGELEAELSVELYRDGVAVAELGGLTGMRMDDPTVEEAGGPFRCALLLRVPTGERAGENEVLISTGDGTTSLIQLDFDTAGYASSSMTWTYGEEEMKAGAVLPLYCVLFTSANTFKTPLSVEEALAHDAAVLFSLKLK